MITGTMGNDDSRTGLVSVWTQGGLWTVDCGGGEAQRVQVVRVEEDRMGLILKTVDASDRLGLASLID
mgnify:CR=1 FL=1